MLLKFIYFFIPFHFLLFFIFIKKISASDCSYIVLIFRAISASTFLLSLLLIKTRVFSAYSPTQKKQGFFKTSLPVLLKELSDDLTKKATKVRSAHYLP